LLVRIQLYAGIGRVEATSAARAASVGLMDAVRAGEAALASFRGWIDAE
jgi:hypothetical protein